jgi:hypothetical protein
MNGEKQSSADKGVRPAFPYSPYVLEVSVGGLFEGRYRLRSDKPTWIGRRPHESSEDFHYIHVPGTLLRFHCLFEWDGNEARLGLKVQASVWINGENVAPDHANLPRQQRLIREGDVIIMSGENRGPRCVRVKIVRAAEEEIEGGVQGIQAEPTAEPDRPRD